MKKSNVSKSNNFIFKKHLIYFAMLWGVIHLLKKEKSAIAKDQVIVKVENDKVVMFNIARLSLILTVALGVIHALVSWGRKEEVFPWEKSIIGTIEANAEIGFYPFEFLFFILSILCGINAIVFYVLLGKKREEISFQAIASISIVVALAVFSLNLEDETTLGRMEKSADTAVEENLSLASQSISDSYLRWGVIMERDLQIPPYIEIDPKVSITPYILTASSDANQTHRAKTFTNSFFPISQEWIQGNSFASFVDVSEVATIDLAGETNISKEDEYKNSLPGERTVFEINREKFTSYPSTELILNISRESPELDSDACYNVYIKYGDQEESVKDSTYCEDEGENTVSIRKFINKVHYTSSDNVRPMSDYLGKSSFKLFVTAVDTNDEFYFTSGILREVNTINFPVLCLEANHKGKPSKVYKSIIGGVDIGERTESAGEIFQIPKVLSKFELGSCDTFDPETMLPGNGTEYYTVIP